MAKEGEIQEVVADKGYHSTSTMKDFKALDIRSYVSEPERGGRKWKGDLKGRDAVYANRRRISGARGRQLLRRRENCWSAPVPIFTAPEECGGPRSEDTPTSSNDS